MFNDELLKKMYVEYGIFRDTLLGNPEFVSVFTEDYRRRTGHQVDVAGLSNHMFKLGKRGEAKGGLPRLKCKYNGRKAS